MRPQASLRRSETSRRKIQSRFSVFTTSSQNKNPAPSVNPGTKQLWQTRCDISANGDLPQKHLMGQKPPTRSTSETKSDGSQHQRWNLRNKHLTSSTNDYQKPNLMYLNTGHDRSETSWSVKYRKRSRQKILTTQTVRATASSPSDMSHLRTLSIEAKHPTDGEKEIHLRNQDLMDLNAGHSLPKTRTNPNNQWVWWTTPGRWYNNKELTASKDHTTNCWIRQYATSETSIWPQQWDPPQKQSLMDLNKKIWQQHHNGSIWCNPTQTRRCSATRFTSETRSDKSQQQQLTAPINQLKEEPSAPQSLSIFDST